MSYISAVRRGDTVYVWEKDPDIHTRVVKEYPAPYYFYVDDEDGKFLTIHGTPVSKKSFSTHKEYSIDKKSNERAGIRMWESDVPPELRVLSNHYYNVTAPKLHITFLDIEVDYDPLRGFSSPSNAYAPINSVSILHYYQNEIVVLVVPPDDTWDEERLIAEIDKISDAAPIPAKYTVKYTVCRSERELLLLLLKEIDRCDAVCGWNSDLFDIPYIAVRLAKVLDEVELDFTTCETVSPNSNKPSLEYENDPNVELAKAHCRFTKKLDFPIHGKLKFRPVTTKENKLMGHTVELTGRIRADYLTLYKKYEPGERASYKLASISELVLVDEETGEPTLPKLEYSGSLADLYRANFPFFVRYNIRDTEILGGFEDKLSYVELANQMIHLSTSTYSHVIGTLKLAECALINYCHHELKRVVPNGKRPDEDRAIDGALVLLPQAGQHRFFGAIDINSLYPSAIRSLNISPETLRGQFVECETAALEVAAGTDTALTFIEESTKQPVTKTAAEWRKWLWDKKWAISGYGTAFDQTVPGFMPALLADWYKQRKHYQKLKKQATELSKTDEANKQQHLQDVGYYDRLQYVFKIKLNSLYGALSNLYFRFYDLRMGESTTGTGRAIVKHQCRKIAEVLDGNYNVDFPMYHTVADAVERGFTLAEAYNISLHGSLIKGNWYGSKFDGKFQTESVIYGDTDSSYFLTHATNVDDACKVADRVADIVNASYQQFVRDTFLCQPGYDDIIKAGREIVSDNGIFVEKKRYIIHVVDLEGQRVDKMKVMGLDTKKTTLPSHISEKLNGFIERYLKGEPWLDVSKSVVEYKDMLKQTDDITYIGLPKGVNKLEEYTANYEADPSTRLPGHVAAAIFYNQYLDNINDLTSPRILSGMKIKQYILAVPFERFKRIALPTDIEFTPTWFGELVINRDAHIIKLVDDPLNNILKAIGKEPPSKQSVFMETFISYD